MRDKILYPLGGVVAALLVMFTYNWFVNRPIIPKIDINGSFSGNYSLEEILKLKKPYICTFTNSDRISDISGTLYIDQEKIAGEFFIKASLLKQEFKSFLIMTNNQVYIWTSLQKVGLRMPVAKSAKSGASPQEQAQIVGLKDKENYICKLWQTNPELFNLPSDIIFP